jgi:hypothetical protein
MVNGQKHPIQRLFERENNEEFGFWAIVFCDIMASVGVLGPTAHPGLPLKVLLGVGRCYRL